MIKRITKISFTALLLLSFTGCDDNKKESEFKASLPKPKWNSKIASFSNNNGGVLFQNADNDPIPAMKIGYAYSEKLKDYNKALEWYKYSDSMKPLAQNSNYACYALQQLKKYDEAISWCEKAIELGSDEALFQLAYTYREKKDYKEAEKWFLKSFEKNDKDAPIALGYLYTNFLNDYKNAEKYYKEGVKIKDLEAFHNLARLYHNNIKDDLKASAYMIALIENKYSKNSALELLQKTWNIPNETIKKGYELQLNSPDFPVKFEGDLGLGK